MWIYESDGCLQVKLMGRACMKTAYYFRVDGAPDNYAEVASLGSCSAQHVVHTSETSSWQKR